MNFEPSCSNANKSDEMRTSPFYLTKTSTYIYNEDEQEEDEDMKKLKLWAGAAAIALGSVFVFRMMQYSKNIQTKVNASIHHIHPSDVKVRFDLTFTNLTDETLRIYKPEVVVKQGKQVLARTELSALSYRLDIDNSVSIDPIFVPIEIAKLSKIDPDGVTVYRKTGEWPPGRIKLNTEIVCIISEKFPYRHHTQIAI